MPQSNNPEVSEFNEPWLWPKKKLDENTARNSLISWVTHIRNHVSFEFVMMVRLLCFCTFVLLYFCTVSNVSLIIKHILNQSFRNLLCAVLTCTGLYRIKQEVGRETNNVESRVNNNLQFLLPTFPPFNIPLRMVGRAAEREPYDFESESQRENIHISGREKTKWEKDDLNKL